MVTHIRIIEFKGALYQQLDYTYPGILIAKFYKKDQLITWIDNGADVSILPYKVYQHAQNFYIIYHQKNTIVLSAQAMVLLKHINLYIFH